MKPKFNKNETEMTLDGKKYTFKPDAPNSCSCRGCAFLASDICVFGHDIRERKCGYTNRKDGKCGVWLEAPGQDAAALSLSHIAALLQGEPVKTCLGTLTLKIG